nr:ectonucleotide pyrophosphatase/phosphodiesterase [Clostridium perfringens]
MNNKYMVVISLDAVSSKDIEIIKELPNISKLMKEGSLIKNVETIYPSLTYPAHVSIITGKYPVNHGITNNIVLNFKDENPNWNWYGNKIKGETLFGLAKKNGLTTASVVWPVTGKMKIDYNMPEIFETKPWHNQIIMSALAGSKVYQFSMNKKFGSLRKGTNEPYLDNFVTACAKETIKKYKPNLTMVHLIDVDSHRHDYGYESLEALEALKRHDIRVGEIIQCLKEAGIYENTTLILLGDHSAIDTHKVIRLNSAFREEGLIELKDGKLKSFKAIARECGGSCYVYLDNKNKEDEKKCLEILKKLKEEGALEYILNKEEAIKVGANDQCDFMVEATRGYYFSNEYEGKVIEETKDIKNEHTYKAVHGYSPRKKIMEHSF